MTWIEKRANREKNLKGASELWAQCKVAVQETVTDFKAYYPQNFTEVKCAELNGHHLQLTLRQDALRRLVAISFDASAQPTITVTIDAGGAKVFKIDADEKECYLTWNGSPINPDKFSEVALHDALFKDIKAPRQERTSKSGPWS